MKEKTHEQTERQEGLPTERVEKYANWMDDAKMAHWIKIKTGETKLLIFTENECSKGENKFGKTQWVFTAVEVNPEGGNITGLYQVTSVKQLSTLSGYAPLKGKCISITRKGDGTATEYYMDEVDVNIAREAIKGGSDVVQRE